jgi:hypothetical protein
MPVKFIVWFQSITEYLSVLDIHYIKNNQRYCRICFNFKAHSFFLPMEYANTISWLSRTNERFR